jgi:hypothetical protein
MKTADEIEFSHRHRADLEKRAREKAAHAERLRKRIEGRKRGGVLWEAIDGPILRHALLLARRDMANALDELEFWKTCPGEFLCGAKTRAGSPCQRPAEHGRRRCKLHGGRSTGPKTQEGIDAIREANLRRWGR